MGATLEQVQGQEGLFRVRGKLDFACVPALLEQGRRLLPRTGRVQIDLGAVESVNSSALALLLEWQGRPGAGGRDLQLLNVPPALVNIAHVSELETVLSLPA